ncbi:hypothetical protein, partial [Endozoicomonas sp. ONNA2]|uniref:hypothetical protein n=1 Tax=Endozoicomonas sp. ONNA2 TaxID=2828741 RepID=UPI0021477315
MSLLKLFRRCVCTVCDTEATKKIKAKPTSEFVKNFGHLFKDINVLQKQFSSISEKHKLALAALLGEYDHRGKQGYMLTDLFFDWFESSFKNSFSIEGPRGAGADIQLSSLFSEFKGEYPCDFVIRDSNSNKIVAIGFARYDSTRGGSQSDDRTGGNNDKVSKAQKFCKKYSQDFKIIFVSDGPGLVHNDTWQEACTLGACPRIDCPTAVAANWS